MLFHRLCTFPEQIPMSWEFMQVLRGENWSSMHSLWIYSLLSGPSCGPSLQEGSSLLRTLFHSSLYGFYHLPQETSLPMGKSHLLTISQGNSGQLCDKHTLPSFHPSLNFGLFFFTISLQGHWCERKISENHLALGLRVSKKGKLVFLEICLTSGMLNLNLVSYTDI